MIGGILWAFKGVKKQIKKRNKPFRKKKKKGCQEVGKRIFFFPKKKRRFDFEDGKM